MKTLKVLLSLIAIVLVIILFQVINGPSSSNKNTQSSPAAEPDRPKLGEKGYVQGGGHAVPVALTEADLDAWTKAQAANDDHGQKNLLLRAKIFSVDNGTKILVIDTAMFNRKIRVLEGEEKGMAGWVVEGHVRK